MYPTHRRDAINEELEAHEQTKLYSENTVHSAGNSLKIKCAGLLTFKS